MHVIADNYQLLILTAPKAPAGATVCQRTSLHLATGRKITRDCSLLVGQNVRTYSLTYYMLHTIMSTHLEV